MPCEKENLLEVTTRETVNCAPASIEKIYIRKNPCSPQTATQICIGQANKTGFQFYHVILRRGWTFGWDKELQIAALKMRYKSNNLNIFGDMRRAGAYFAARMEDQQYWGHRRVNDPHSNPSKQSPRGRGVRKEQRVPGSEKWNVAETGGGVHV